MRVQVPLSAPIEIELIGTYDTLRTIDNFCIKLKYDILSNGCIKNDSPTRRSREANFL